MTKETKNKIDRINSWKAKGLSTKDACKKVKLSQTYYYHMNNAQKPKKAKAVPTIPTPEVAPHPTISNLKVSMSDGTEISFSGPHILRALSNISTW